MGGLFSSEEKKYRKEFLEIYGNIDDNQIVELSPELYNYFYHTEEKERQTLKLWTLVRKIYCRQREADEKDQTLKSGYSYLQVGGLITTLAQLKSDKYPITLLEFQFAIPKELLNVESIRRVSQNLDLDFERIAEADDDNQSVVSKQTIQTVTSANSESGPIGATFSRKISHKSSKKTSKDKLNEAIGNVVSDARIQTIHNLLQILKTCTSQPKKAVILRIIPLLLSDSIDKTSLITTEDLINNNLVEETTEIKQAILTAVCKDKSDDRKFYSAENKIKFLTCLAIAFSIKPLNFFPESVPLTSAEKAFALQLKNKCTQELEQLLTFVLSPIRLEYIKQLQVVNNSSLITNLERYTLICAMIALSASQSALSADEILEQTLSGFSTETANNFRYFFSSTITTENDSLSRSPIHQELIDYAKCWLYVMKENPSLVLNRPLKANEITELSNAGSFYVRMLRDVAKKADEALEQSKLEVIAEGTESQENTPVKAPITKKTDAQLIARIGSMSENRAKETVEEVADNDSLTDLKVSNS